MAMNRVQFQPGLDQRRFAFVVAAVPVHKLDHRVVNPSSTPTGSQREPAEVRR